MFCPSFEFRAHVFNTVSYHKFFFGSMLYFLNQDRFIKALPLGNGLCSIDVNFANNVEYVQMFSQKYFTQQNVARNFFCMPVVSAADNVYMYAMSKKKLSNNQEIERFIENSRSAQNVNWTQDMYEGLDSQEILLDDRKKFDDIVHDLCGLPDNFMRSVVELFFKHNNYSNTFYVQGRTCLHFNINDPGDGLNIWRKDFVRNNDLRDLNKKSNSRRWETLSYYSRHMILCFFRTEYLYKDEKPDPKLVEFYVALNSLLSAREKENAKAILNADEKKLTE